MKTKKKKKQSAAAESDDDGSDTDLELEGEARNFSCCFRGSFVLTFSLNVFNANIFTTFTKC